MLFHKPAVIFATASLLVGVFWNIQSEMARSIPGSSSVPHAARIAFSSLPRPGSSFKAGLYTIKASGGDRHSLTPTLEFASQPIWSPNGQRLAFTANEADVYVVDANGSRPKKVFAGEYCKGIGQTLAWLVNNQQLAFAQSCDGSTLDAPGSVSLYLSNTADTRGTRLVKSWQSWYDSTKGGIKSNFAFSPKGSQAGFVYDQNTYRINTDGSELVKLTEGIGHDNHDFSQVQWSPDGRLLARIDVFTGAAPEQRIYVLKSDGTIVAQLTNSHTEWGNYQFVWSPDSKQFVYAHTESATANQRDLYLFDVATHRSQLLTQKPGEYESLIWSPDGKQIAFTIKTGQSLRIYALTVNNLTLKKLTPAFANMRDLAWSPDSQQLAFVGSMASQNSGLYVVDRAGSRLQQLTRTEDIFNPMWQP